LFNGSPEVRYRITDEANLWLCRGTRADIQQLLETEEMSGIFQ
jgi:hypothetical protein